MAEHPSVDADTRGGGTLPSRDVVAGWLGDDDDLDEQELVADPDVPPAEFRDTLGRFASGITVVTAISGGVPVGLTCQSFTSVSLDPPLVLFCPSRTSRAWPLIQRTGAFCVNVLAHDQADVSDTMASRGIDKFARVAWAPSAETGSPVLAGVLAHVDCTVASVQEAGDHYVVLGRVQHVSVERPDADGLVFFRGRYGRTSL